LHISRFCTRAKRQQDFVRASSCISRARHSPSSLTYLADYSKNGKTIYIDRHSLKSFSFGRAWRRVKTDRFLILHETVEKTLMNHLGLRYLHGRADRDSS
jgi:hypothetical protein